MDEIDEIDRQIDTSEVTSLQQIRMRGRGGGFKVFKRTMCG
jgi:hypothetical protein